METRHAMSKIGIVYSDRYLEHETGAHVENPGRVTAIRDELLAASWTDRLQWLAPRAASPQDIAMIHDRSYVEYIKKECEYTRGISYLNPDTAICPESYEVALLAAGGVMEGIDRLFAKEVDGFFALVRPPGHHAEADESHGFCLFNNIAIGARYAQENHNVGRVFILDWDIHHGNGTQHSFDKDPSVFFCSFHQSPHYPGTGGRTEMGIDDGFGYTLNLPMRPGSGNDDYMYLMEECVGPAIRRFEPELLLISAGFDGHRSDPLGGALLDDGGFAAIFEHAREAARCPVGIVLEGGYNYESLASSSAAVTGVFVNSEQPSYISLAKSPGRGSVDLAAFMREQHPCLKDSWNHK